MSVRVRVCVSNVHNAQISRRFWKLNRVKIFVCVMATSPSSSSLSMSETSFVNLNWNFLPVNLFHEESTTTQSNKWDSQSVQIELMKQILNMCEIIMLLSRLFRFILIFLTLTARLVCAYTSWARLVVYAMPKKRMCKESVINKIYCTTSNCEKQWTSFFWAVQNEK